MRVLIIVTSMAIGGVQAVVAGVADDLASRGHKVAVISIFGDDEVETGAGIVRLQLGLRSASPKELVKTLRLNRWIEDFEPDVVSSHAIHANLVASYLSACRRRPLVRAVHSLREGGWVHRVAFRAAARRSFADVAVSTAVANHHVASGMLRSKQVTVIRNGVNLEVFKFDPTDRFRVRRDLALGPREFGFLHVGRFTKAKAHDDLLRAFAKVVTVGLPLRLTMVGDGELRPQAEDLARELQIEDVVHFVGTRSDIPALMSASDCFVSSSHWEGFPVAVSEAVANGLPVVATDVGGTREALAGWGVLVPSGEPMALSEAMRVAAEACVGHTTPAAAHLSIDVTFEAWFNMLSKAADSAP